MRIYCLTLTIISTRIRITKERIVTGRQATSSNSLYRIKHNIIVGTFNGQRSARD